MNVTRAALAVALAVGVGPVWADNAKPRGGSGGGGGSSSGSHHSGGSSGSSAHSSGHSGDSHSSSASSSSSGSRQESSARVGDAERRHPRPGTGRLYRYGRGYYNYNYYPRYFPTYRSFYYGSYYPYYDYYGFYDYPPYYYGGYGYRRGYGYSSVGSVRLMVDPDKARVYVDGYYAGVVDDYDGLFQRLHVKPGRHEIALKMDGYRTHRMKVYVPYDETLKIHYDMVRGDGEDLEDMAGPADRDGYDRRASRDDDDDDGVFGGAGETRPADRDGAAPGQRNGELRLNVRPDDASIYVDGAFRGTARQLRMLRVEAGRHRVEVVRPGFRTWERDVDVKPGDSASVEVELER